MTDMYSHKLSAVILPGIVRRKGRAFPFLLHCNVLCGKETMARKHVLPKECGFQPRSGPWAPSTTNMEVGFVSGSTFVSVPVSQCVSERVRSRWVPEE